MVNGMYTIYDKVAQEAGPLFLAKNDAVALRMVTNSPEFKNMNLGDFELYLVGTYDSEAFGTCAKQLPVSECAPHLVKWSEVNDES